MATRTWLHAALKVSTLSVMLLAGCSNDDPEGALVSGNVKSVISDAVQASAAFVVKDLEHFSADPVASGTSDASGNYSFRVEDALYLVVLFTVPDEPGPSGLVSVAEGDATKPLNDVTSLACAAGVGAVLAPRTTNPVQAAEMDRARITNLELGASLVIDQDHPDFTNSDSFNAAVARVREITADGDHPPTT